MDMVDALEAVAIARNAMLAICEKLAQAMVPINDLQRQQYDASLYLARIKWGM